MLAIECILNLWKVLYTYFVMYISTTAALYYKMYLFGLTLVIWSFKIYVNTNCSVLKLLASLIWNYFPKRSAGAPLHTL